MFNPPTLIKTPGLWETASGLHQWFSHCGMCGLLQVVLRVICNFRLSLFKWQIISYCIIMDFCSCFFWLRHKFEEFTDILVLFYSMIRSWSWLGGT